MAYQQSDLDTLKAAIATGARLVRYADGRAVEYRSLAEMRRILEDIANELAGAQQAPVMLVVGGYRSGLS